MNSLIKIEHLKALMIVVALIVVVWSGTIFLAGGLPLEDSEENTAKTIALMKNAEIMRRSGALFTGIDKPFVAGFPLCTPLTSYFIEGVGTVYWWSGADSVIDAKYKELREKEKSKFKW